MQLTRHEVIGQTFEVPRAVGNYIVRGAPIGSGRTSMQNARVCVFFLGASEHVGHLDCVKPLARLGLRMSAKARIRHGNIYHIESG